MSNVVEFPNKEPKRIGGNVLNTPYGDITPKDIQAEEPQGRDHKIGVSGRGRVTPHDFDFTGKVYGSLNDPSPAISYEQGTIKYGMCFAQSDTEDELATKRFMEEHRRMEQELGKHVVDHPICDKDRDALDAFRYAIEKYRENTGVMPQVIAGTPEAFRKLGASMQGLSETINEAVAELKERLGGAVAEFTGKELTTETMKLIREKIDESFRDEFLRLQGYTLVGVDLASDYAKEFSGKVEIIMDDHIAQPKIAYVGCSGAGGSSLIEAMRKAIMANEVCFPTVEIDSLGTLMNEMKNYKLDDLVGGTPMNRAERRGHTNEKPNYMRADVCPRGGTKTVKKKQHRR
jgi:hypothetical protein